jgi:UDP-N-acetylmuramate: L-alanyl-gamma-D-glutamyl-meso-diaminopimelate ligase
VPETLGFLALFDTIHIMNSEALSYYHQWILKEPDASNRILDRDLSGLANLVPKKTRIHLIGICGKGTATLAGLLIAKGFQVTGSDNAFYPPMSTVVENLGIPIFKEYDSANIQGADVVIVGNVCPPDHIEVLAARKQHILQISMSEALEYFLLQDKKNIIVTGTHGKTTLTGMLAWILEHAKLDPLYFIGGVIQGSLTSYKFSKGAYALLEGDEYDTAYFDKGPKFLHYKPWCGIITSCEYDHVTMYASFEEYQQAYRFFIDEIDPTGFLVIHETAHGLLEKSCASFAGTIIVYGPSTLSSARLPELLIPGIYNQENALAAYLVATQCCGLDSGAIKKYLAVFPGMERRQQVLLENDHYLFIDDFAHHPTAVRLTLEGLRERYPHRRIICLFEPRSVSSRRKIFEQAYSESFNAANIIGICAPKFRENDDPKDFVDIHHIVECLNASGKKAYASDKTHVLLEILSDTLIDQDIIVTMSNASFDGIQEKIISLLS